MDDDNNIENNNKEIETINSNFGEKLINSDMERLNKENEISTKEKIEVLLIFILHIKINIMKNYQPIF